ncbi:MAG: histidine kinase [Bacteroidetes bacterium]|nr:histidine kinase [Bacteroidota bacterium]
MSRPTHWMDYLFTRQRWIIHVFFWLLVLALYVIFFGRKNNNYLQTFFFVGLLMPITIFTTYFLNYYLVPNYLMKERYGYFVTYFIYTVIGSLFLEMLISALTFIVMAETNIHAMSPASIDLFFLLASLLVVVFFAWGIKMLLHWRQSKEDFQKLMRDKVEAELNFLKVQLNPHFLFNTMNNLYYLTTQKSEQAPQAILQLSEMLDYALHQGKLMRVPLENELKQVDNYIALEMLRYEDRIQLEKRITGETSYHQIGPMMLITLIENAFKHGVMKVAGNSWIRIAIHCTSEKADITISNSKRSEKMESGIGLDNLKRQLEHLFQDHYQLDLITDQPEEFSVRLQLTTQR